MFRRKEAVAPIEESPALDTGKGRPTPTRKEAEAAAKARAVASRDPKARRAYAKDAKSARMESSRAIRDGIKAGDERYLGRRDKGPVRRFIRDFVDTRLNIAEFTIPLMFASLLLSGANPELGGGILNATVLVVTLDSAWLVFKLKRELKQRFPEESRKGTTFYALTRALQLRFMRIPKSQVKLGQKLPDTYR